MLRLVGFVLGALDLTVAQAVGLVEALVELLLDGEGQLEGHGGDRLDQQLADGGVDVGADEALTGRVTEVAAAADADVNGHAAVTGAGAVAHVHAAAAQTAHGVALQQRRTLSRGAARSLPGERLGVFLQALLDALVLVPREVAGMGVLDERLPLTRR